MSGISRILTAVTERFVGTSATQPLAYARMARILESWRTCQVETPKLNQGDKSKYSLPIERRGASSSGDGDVIHLDISNPRLSREGMSKILRGDTVLKWKE